MMKEIIFIRICKTLKLSIHANNLGVICHFISHLELFLTAWVQRLFVK